MDSFGNSLVRVHGLGSCNNDGLDTNVGETGVDESAKESQEVAGVPLDAVVIGELGNLVSLVEQLAIMT